jgi:hypothetical protein
LPQAEAA